MFLDNYELLDQQEQLELVAWLTFKNAVTHDQGIFNEARDRQSELMKEVQERMYLSERHGLNYAKLYMDYQGGYDMEKLKDVLENIKKD